MRNRIPVGGRRHLKRKLAHSTRVVKETPEPIETIVGFDACEKAYPWLLPLLDVGYLGHEDAYWARERRLTDRERRATKTPWTVVEWRDLGPGLQSAVPKPRRRTEVMEAARMAVRKRAA